MTFILNLKNKYLITVLVGQKLEEAAGINFRAGSDFLPFHEHFSITMYSVKAIHCPKNNQNFCIKTELITSGPKTTYIPLHLLEL